MFQVSMAYLGLLFYKNKIHVPVFFRNLLARQMWYDIVRNNGRVCEW